MLLNLNWIVHWRAYNFLFMIFMSVNKKSGVVVGVQCNDLSMVPYIHHTGD